MSKGVRLPMPFSPATSKVASLTTIARATTASFFSRLIPRTPAAGRPIARTSSSENRMLMPSRVMRTTWSCPEVNRSEEHTSELQSHSDLVCRLLLEKKKKKKKQQKIQKQNKTNTN